MNSETSTMTDHTLKSLDRGLISTLDPKNFVFPTLPKIEEILSLPNPEEVIQSLPPQQLYLAFINQGVEETFEALRFLSQDQFCRIIDYDIWQKSELSPARALRWLSLCNEIDPELMYERFLDLDEECQIAILHPYIRTCDAEFYERLTDDLQDQYQPFPGQELYYSITTTEPEIGAAVQNLIDSLITNNMQFTMSILAQTQFELYEEVEDRLRQFSYARMEEDGFITFDEAQFIFYPLKPQEMKRFVKLYGAKNQDTLETSQKTLAFVKDPELIFLKALKNIEKSLQDQPSKQLDFSQRYLNFYNYLASALDLGRDDFSGLKLIEKNGISVINLGLEALGYKADNPQDIKDAAELLLTLQPSLLFRVGYTAIHKLKEEWLELLRVSEIKNFANLEKYLLTGKFGLVLDWVDKNLQAKCDLIELEIFKGVFSRFPYTVDQAHPQHEGQTRIYFKNLETLDELNTLRKMPWNIIAH